MDNQSKDSQQESQKSKMTQVEFAKVVAEQKAAAFNYTEEAKKQEAAQIEKMAGENDKKALSDYITEGKAQLEKHNMEKSLHSTEKATEKQIETFKSLMEKRYPKNEEKVKEAVELAGRMNKGELYQVIGIEVKRAELKREYGALQEREDKLSLNSQNIENLLKAQKSQSQTQKKTQDTAREQTAGMEI